MSYAHVFEGISIMFFAVLIVGFKCKQRGFSIIRRVAYETAIIIHKITTTPVVFF